MIILTENNYETKKQKHIIYGRSNRQSNQTHLGPNHLKLIIKSRQHPLPINDRSPNIQSLIGCWGQPIPKAIKLITKQHKSWTQRTPGEVRGFLGGEDKAQQAASLEDKRCLE